LLQQHGSFGHAGACNASTAASKPGSSVGAAVAASTAVPAGATRVVSFLAGLGVPRCQVPRRDNVPQVSVADPALTSGLSLSVITDIA